MDPRTYRLSKHFVLSDFLGCHSVYSRGYKNPFDFEDPAADLKLANVQTLCEHGLEKVLELFGPLSIGYGYISPDLSRLIVRYQDPDKPSHHRFDLGAASDFCAHRWVAGDFPAICDLYAPESALASPIALAHGLDYQDIPYSRLITYSESPYLCLALSAKEVEAGKPRKAFYENRYQGVAKSKPEYRQYATPFARTKAFEDLQTNGLEHPWQGAGYPTYHGGGRKQYHHMRVSKYTMVSDWLFDLKSVSEGHKNIPNLMNEQIQDSFAAAGIVYDWMIQTWDVPRASIVSGYVAHSNPSFRRDNDWRNDTITFLVNPPDPEGHKGHELDHRAVELNLWAPAGVQFTVEDDFILAVVDVSTVLDSKDFG